VEDNPVGVLITQPVLQTRCCVRKMHVIIDGEARKDIVKSYELYANCFCRKPDDFEEC
jgi:hypothetical protein